MRYEPEIIMLLDVMGVEFRAHFTLLQYDRDEFSRISLAISCSNEIYYSDQVFYNRQGD